MSDAARELVESLSGLAARVRHLEVAEGSSEVSLPGSSVVDITVTAGENLSARDCCYIELNGAVGDAGRAYKADADEADTSSEAWVVGFATASATAGNDVTLRIAGIMTGFSGLTPGAPQYVSATAGAITESAPGNKWMVGVALSATTVLVNTRGAQDSVAAVPVSTYGYFAGGLTTVVVATADRLTFSTSTTAAHSDANLSKARRLLAGCSDASTYGYFAGGYTSSNFATADRLTFSTSATAAQTSANLSQARRGLAGCSDGSAYGYFAGGDTGDAGFNVVTADRLTFSTSTTAAQSSADLSAARTKLAACSDGAMYGYFAGGYTTAVVATTDRLTFSTSTTAACTTANLSQARSALPGLADYAI